MDKFNQFIRFLEERLNRRIWSIVSASVAFLGFCGAVVVGPASLLSPVFWVPGLLGLLFLAALWFRTLVAWIRRIDWKHAVGSGIAFAAFLVLLVLANVFLARRPIRVDLTSTRLYTLSPVSKQILKGLDEPVRIVFFRTPAGVNQSVADILRLYEKASRLVKVETVDPEEKPLLAKQYDLQSLPINNEPVYSTVFIEQAGRTEKVDGLTVDFVPNSQGGVQPMVDLDRELERKISSAIDRLRGPVKKIYFTAGHGEGDIASTEKTGFSRLRNYLSQENYDTDLFHPAVSASVPGDAALVVILDPRKRFEDREISVLDAYLRSGGRLLILANPGRPHGLNRLVKDWGFSFTSDTVVDPASCYWFQPAVPYVTRYGLHAAVENLAAASVFPEAGSLVRAETPPTDSAVKVRELVRTSDKSWGETEAITPEKKPTYTEGIDGKGPRTIGIAAETEVEGVTSGVIAFGDADFAANAFADLGSNLDLFLNCVNYLAAKKELSGIASRAGSRRTMTLGNSSIRFLFLISVVLLPASFLASGIVFFWRRRRR
jgi:hypothetical protein